jgi:ABC-type proline/glycine betaine transport system permease subunit
MVVVVDPIEARRARFALVAKVGKRVGYSALAVAIVAFFIGVAASFPTWTVTVSVIGLVTACIVLPIPIVIGYGVRAAAREDRERG